MKWSYYIDLLAKETLHSQKYLFCYQESSNGEKMIYLKKVNVVSKDVVHKLERNVEEGQ